MVSLNSAKNFDRLRNCAARRGESQIVSDLWQTLQRGGAINAKELGEQENKQRRELFEGEP
jgi:hypothetical protein